LKKYTLTSLRKLPHLTRGNGNNGAEKYLLIIGSIN